MKRILIGLGVFLFLIGNANAQKKKLSVEDAAYNRELRTKGKSYNWLPNSSKISYVVGEKEDAVLVVRDMDNLFSDTTITLKDLNQAIDDKHMDFKLEEFPKYSWSGGNMFRFGKDGTYYDYNQETKELLIAGSIEGKGQFMEVHAGTYNHAFIKEDNLFVRTAEFERKITYDGGKGIVYGQTVHQSEFGIKKGLFWSPSGTKLAFYRMDEKRVTDYPIYVLDKVPATHRDIKYPTAGDSSHTVTIGIYDLEKSTITYLSTEGPYDQFLTNITWSPNGESVYVAWLNRGQNHMKLQRYNAVSGDLDKVLFEEKNDKYVEPEHGPIFLKSDEEKFMWYSERDGYNHLYLYNTKGKLLKQLTTGKWIVTDVVGLDKEGKNLFITGTKESALERHLYQVSMETGSINKLTRNAGTHSQVMNSDGTKFLDYYSAMEVPLDIRVINTDGNIIETLYKADNPIKDYEIGKIEISPLNTANGILYQRMIYPPNFNPENEYPVIVYLYGGPHSQQITNSWLGGARMEFLYWAQQGYIVYTVDNRGSANRGFAFESTVHRRLGDLEMEDQMEGVKFLKSLPYVDANRMGIHGWSYGGFMTTSMMSRNPGVFKAGVAGGPVIDWSYYEIMYTERYMDTPKENPEGYKKANLLNYVGDLEGRLLMIHGTDDNVVLWQHSMLYVQKAVDLNKLNLDYYIYPKHEHNVRGKDRIHLIGKISQYLFEHI